jgi:hypothetical protein
MAFNSQAALSFVVRPSETRAPRPIDHDMPTCKTTLDRFQHFAQYEYPRPDAVACSVPWRASRQPSGLFLAVSTMRVSPMTCAHRWWRPSFTQQIAPAVPETKSEPKTLQRQRSPFSQSCIIPLFAPNCFLGHLPSLFFLPLLTLYHNHKTTLILVPYTSLPTHHSAPCTPVALLRGQRPQSSERASGRLHDLIAPCSGTHPPFAYSSRSAPYKPSRRHRTMRKTTRLLVSTLSRRASTCSSRISSSQIKPPTNTTLSFPSPAQPPTQKHMHKMFRH